MNWEAAVPWLIAVFGWLVTHLFSEARERRKEVRSQLDKQLDRLLKIEEAARDFHKSTTYEDKKADSIIAELSRLERAIQRIPRMNGDFYVQVLTHLRRSITLKNFDKSSFSAQDSSSELFSEINSAVQDFEDEIEAQYCRSFPSKFPYFKMRND